MKAYPRKGGARSQEPAVCWKELREQWKTTKDSVWRGPNNFPEQGKDWAFGEVQLPSKPHKLETWLRPTTETLLSSLPGDDKGGASHRMGS